MKTVKLSQAHNHGGIEYPAGTTVDLPDADADWLLGAVPGTVVAGKLVLPGEGKLQADRRGANKVEPTE